MDGSGGAERVFGVERFHWGVALRPRELFALAVEQDNSSKIKHKMQRCLGDRPFHRQRMSYGKGYAHAPYPFSREAG